MNTKARSLHGTQFEGIPKGENVTIEKRDKIYYKFDDGSEAWILTRFEDCEPYMTGSLSTLAKKPVQYWQAV